MGKMELPIVQNLRFIADIATMDALSKQWCKKGAEVIERFDAELARLRAENAKLREALEPFAALETPKSLHQKKTKGNAAIYGLNFEIIDHARAVLNGEDDA